MKYCKHCGAELVDDAVVCQKCGCPTDEGQNLAANQGAVAQPKPGLTVSIVAISLAVVMFFVSLFLTAIAYYVLAVPVLVLGIIGTVYASKSLKAGKTQKGVASLTCSIISLVLWFIDLLLIVLIIVGALSGLI